VPHSLSPDSKRSGSPGVPRQGKALLSPEGTAAAVGEGGNGGVDRLPQGSCPTISSHAVHESRLDTGAPPPGPFACSQTGEPGEPSAFSRSEMWCVSVSQRSYW
jgi:hypothetical protein